MKHSSNMPCPSCQQAMKIKAVHCDACDLTVSGEFETTEFAQLSAEDLQFLRVFLHAEGRIREMEGPLGLSYPTIRTRLATLKDKVFSKTQSPPAPAPASTSEALAKLQRGEMSFEDALKAVKKKR